MAVRPIIRCVIIDLYKESDVTFFENRLETGKTAKTRFSLVSLVQGCTTHHSMGNRELMYCKSRHFSEYRLKTGINLEIPVIISLAQTAAKKGLS